MDTVPRQQHHACFLTHDTSLVMIGYVDFKKVINIRVKSTNDGRPVEEGGAGKSAEPQVLRGISERRVVVVVVVGRGASVG